MVDTCIVPDLPAALCPDGPIQRLNSLSGQSCALPPDVLWPRLNDLEAAIAAQDVEGSLEVLAELVPEWRRSEVLSV